MVLLNPEHLKEIHTLKGGTMSVSELFIKAFPPPGNCLHNNGASKEN